MKFLILVVSCLFALQVTAQKKSTADTANKMLLVEASCGQCQFKMKGGGCTLAIKIKDSTYYVQGTKIDDHGDAHSNEGFCNAVRMANVKGTVINGKFVATYFKLLPLHKEE